ncbi:hypothetical protein MCOR25_006892 [Pyricularia grisea]|uniref:Elongation of fatty acids protein n=1 Tax=Pyricularia grisea TaxID=148305 RepID=A0A6P8BDK8_PYRGI|nr:uncharacterized protein PgNI_04498 [Pyricularia grisea]KAI6359902.1 hypothetical protein MCOR25_006892 [Pyricularia grisea]TLD13898.1 hypothetical protein PgNI_04498 [Pyricularia grisea]
MASTGPIHWGLPSPALFSFPPKNVPDYITPISAQSHGSSAFVPPFHIPDHVYSAWLDAKVPITIAATYAITIKLLNAYNKSRNKRPWAISKTKAFFWFVVAHNVFLAVYSAWTWWGTLGMLRRSILSPTGPAGWAGTADSFCRVFGPPGIGNGMYYSDVDHRWHSHAHGAPLPAGPDRTTSGRMWNEGLAFYGWLFYISKFYEVIDTLIIIAKGKQSSTLQTYHHAGAMMCMWAGMRYMAVPIWTFLFFNSFIHAMMYTYYTLTAFHIKVPVFIKRSLTTMQITQFVVGASYAMVHSFVSYTIPVALNGNPVTAAPGAAATPAGASTTSGAIIDNMKNMIGGLVGSKPATAVDAAPSGMYRVAGLSDTTTYGQRVVPCISSTGETFAIWLNVLYLAPLTYLFVMFFISSYLRRSSVDAARFKKGTSARRESNVALAEKAGWEAARQVEKEVYGGEDVQVHMNGNGKAKKSNGVAASPNGKARSNGKRR